MDGKGSGIRDSKSKNFETVGSHYKYFHAILQMNKIYLILLLFIILVFILLYVSHAFSIYESSANQPEPNKQKPYNPISNPGALI